MVVLSTFRVIRLTVIANNLFPRAYTLSQFQNTEPYKRLPIAENDEETEVQVLLGSDYEMEFLLTDHIQN